MNLLPITGDLVRAFGWTILHSMWQAFFVYACLQVVLKLWPLASARIKYNLSLLSLSGIFTWFLITLYMHVQRLQEARTFAIQLSGDHQLPGTATTFPAVYASQDPLMWLFPNLEVCFPILVTLYVAGMIVMTIKLLSDLFQLQKIRTTKVQPMGAAWDKHLDKLAAQLQIPRKVKLLISRHVQVPVMMGFLKPLILLPVAMVNNLTEEQLEAILLHELAHIKRNDYLLNIFQSIVETILFFNPFIWLISKTIRLEREHCCDDLVITSTVQPLHYARALVALEEYRLTANPLTMAVADNRQHLFHRIKRIMEMKTKHLNYSQKFLAVLIIATGLVSIAWLNPAKGKDHETAQVKEKQVTKQVAPQTSVVVAVNTTQQVTATPAINSYKYCLAAAVRDTLDPTEPVIPPTLPVAPTPLAPLTPVEPLTRIEPSPDVEVVDNSQEVVIDSSAPRSKQIRSTINVRVAKDPKTGKQQTISSQTTYNDDSWVNKEEIKKQICEAQRNVQQAMKQLHEVDMKRVQAEVKAATEKIDWKAFSVDVQKAQQEATAALKSIDWDKINSEVKNAYKSVDWNDMSEKMHRDLTAGKLMAEKARKEAEINMELARKRRAEGLLAAKQGREDAWNAREAEGRAKEATGRARAAAGRAKVAAEKAHASSQQYREMINKMAADNLLDTKTNYTIEKNSTGLYINGVKQPANVADKYNSYLTQKNITIKGSPDNLNINAEN
ncbi:beta-lactamase regulating signal transducer with metallopeptidase domain [Chitinophaga niastensis]|uniref:Beta-lactamase regulating signal transducer with metallopeptidase domain n=1 Tax=Chitinophaga niastensis TaxID=536980 RepID=A0A2P8HPJ8_CHINA|nr:M56 family metallopeptidase [Chitinophaga niastensis]PSL48141.1 beta-lactamase regulating signal transducer with metallopeptidase domain [Chitinophaga niastensis]